MSLVDTIELDDRDMTVRERILETLRAMSLGKLAMTINNSLVEAMGATLSEVSAHLNDAHLAMGVLLEHIANGRIGHLPEEKVRK